MKGWLIKQVCGGLHLVLQLFHLRKESDRKWQVNFNAVEYSKADEESCLLGGIISVLDGQNLALVEKRSLMYHLYGFSEIKILLAKA